MTANTDIIIIGSGPAGMMAGIAAKAAGAGPVVILEHNEKTGKKLYITGKGRCNLTNDCAETEFLQNVVTNPKFLYKAIYSFPPSAAIAFFEGQGLKLKTERGKRVFPASDKSSDVIAALNGALKKAGVEVRLNCRVKNIVSLRGAQSATSQSQHIENAPISLDGCRMQTAGCLAEAGYFEVSAANGEKFVCRKLILACGGKSYPATGSTGDGYEFAKRFGHKIVAPRPALVPILVKEPFVKQLEGLSLKNTGFRVIEGGIIGGAPGGIVGGASGGGASSGVTGGGKVLYEDFGEMLFTADGISGPLALSASSVISNAQFTMHNGRLMSNEVSGNRYQVSGKGQGNAQTANGQRAMGNGQCKGDEPKNCQLSIVNCQLDKADRAIGISLDLKPALSKEHLDARILRDFSAGTNRQFKNSLDELLPKSLIPVAIALSGIPENKALNQISKDERVRLVNLLKDFRLTVRGLAPIEEGIVTAGGVDVREVNPSTMESRFVPGLYFAGEMLDVDALTGGFNIHIALATGRLAGESAGRAPACHCEANEVSRRNPNNINS